MVSRLPNLPPPCWRARCVASISGMPDKRTRCTKLRAGRFASQAIVRYFCRAGKSKFSGAKPLRSEILFATKVNRALAAARATARRTRKTLVVPDLFRQPARPRPRNELTGPIWRAVRPGFRRVRPGRPRPATTATMCWAKRARSACRRARSASGDIWTLFAGTCLGVDEHLDDINATAPWLMALYVTVAEEQGAARRAQARCRTTSPREFLARGTCYLPARRPMWLDHRRDRVHHKRDPEVEPDQRLLLPPGGGSRKRTPAELACVVERDCDSTP